MKRFIQFDRMVTPAIIKAVFWIGVIVTVLAGLAQIFAGMSAPFGGGAQVVGGLLIIILGPLFTRIYCELLIILFKMHETLQKINDNLKQSD
mgnify:FL=1